MAEFIIKCNYEKLFEADVDLDLHENELDDDRIISGNLEDDLLELDENEEIVWKQVGETSFDYTGLAL